MTIGLVVLRMGCKMQEHPSKKKNKKKKILKKKQVLTFFDKLNYI